MVQDSVTTSVAMEILGLKVSQARQVLHDMVVQNMLETRVKKRNRTYVLKIPRLLWGEGRDNG